MDSVQLITDIVLLSYLFITNSSLILSYCYYMISPAPPYSMNSMIAENPLRIIFNQINLILFMISTFVSYSLLFVVNNRGFSFPSSSIIITKIIVILHTVPVLFQGIILLCMTYIQSILARRGSVFSSQERGNSLYKVVRKSIIRYQTIIGILLSILFCATIIIPEYLSSWNDYNDQIFNITYYVLIISLFFCLNLGVSVQVWSRNLLLTIYLLQGICYSLYEYMHLSYMLNTSIILTNVLLLLYIVHYMYFHKEATHPTEVTILSGRRTTRHGGGGGDSATNLTRLSMSSATSTTTTLHEDIVVLEGIIIEGGEDLAAFRKFLESEFSSENLDFYLEVVEYIKTWKNSDISDVELRNRAITIYNEYINLGSNRQVNLPSNIKYDIDSTLLNTNLIMSPTYENKLHTVFDLAHEEIKLLMTRDSYQRFKKTAR